MKQKKPKQSYEVYALVPINIGTFEAKSVNEALSKTKRTKTLHELKKIAPLGIKNFVITNLTSNHQFLITEKDNENYASKRLALNERTQNANNTVQHTEDRQGSVQGAKRSVILEEEIPTGQG